MNNSSRNRAQKMGMMLMDVVMIHIGFLGAYFLIDNEAPSRYLLTAPWLLAAFLVVFYLFDVYKAWRRKSFQHLLFTLLIALGLYHALLLSTHLLRGADLFTIKVLLAAFILHSITIITGRFIYWSSLRKMHGTKQLLIIGENEEVALELADKLMSHDQGWFQIAGYRSEPVESDLLDIDAVLISPSTPIQRKRDIVSLCNANQKEMLIVPEMFEIMLLDTASEQIDDMLILSVLPAKMKTGQLIVKRVFDLVLSSIIFTLASPVMAFLFFIIPLTSTGPALYSQERIGKNKRPYKIYKFRSMVQDAEKQTGPVLASDADKRITKVGNFIRATRLDELPQLFNVLKGEMSLIGPRPERLFFIEQFEKQNPHYVNRLAVKPGLTGLAQVMANYTTTVEDKLRYDLLYIRNYSFVLDMKILMQTIRVIAQGEQASGLKMKDMERKQELQKLLFSNKAAGQ